MQSEQLKVDVEQVAAKTADNCFEKLGLDKENGKMDQFDFRAWVKGEKRKGEKSKKQMQENILKHGISGLFSERTRKEMVKQKTPTKS